METCPVLVDAFLSPLLHPNSVDYIPLPKHMPHCLLYFVWFSVLVGLFTLALIIDVLCLLVPFAGHRPFTYFPAHAWITWEVRDSVSVGSSYDS